MFTVVGASAIYGLAEGRSLLTSFLFSLCIISLRPNSAFSFFLSQQAVAGHHIPALLRSIDLHGVSALLPQLMLNAK